MAITKIEWANRVWNFILGCTKIGPGCENCFAILEVVRERCEAHCGLAKRKPRPNWTGKLRVRPEKLMDPLRVTKSASWFVNSLSDMFHEKMPIEWQIAGLEVMRMANWHQFLILTKRSENMRDLLNGPLHEYAALPNVYYGVSAEDRKHGLPRVRDLQASAALHKWVSFEPLLEDLGAVDLTGLDGIVLGGESGNGSRPMHPDWARSIRDQSNTANVPYFYKQWGNWIPPRQEMKSARVYEWDDGTTSIRVTKKEAGRLLDGQIHDALPSVVLAASPDQATSRKLVSRAEELAGKISILEVLPTQNRELVQIT